MNTVPLADFADSVVRMRSSLARVELAASRIARDSLTPATLELATDITQSVREIDDEIGAALRALRTEPDARIDIGDCAQVLAAMRDRMLPVLHAHEIDWPIVEEAPGVFLEDRVVVKRAALLMLRAGIALAGHGGRLLISLVHDDEKGIGVQLITEQAIDSPGKEISMAESLSGARAFGHRHRGSLEVLDTAGGGALVILWLAPSEVE